MSLPIALVVLDIAGTTVRDNGEITLAFQQAMSRSGYEVPAEKITPLMGYKKTEAIRLLLDFYETNDDKITPKLIHKIHQDFLERMVFFYATSKELSPLPNVEKVFAGLKSQGIKVALNTGFSNEITDIIMERLGWLENNLVDFVISSNEVAAGRPLPYMINELMNRAGIVHPEQVIKVGDTEVDIFEGRNAGCLYSIGVTTGAFSRKELEAYNPSFIIDNIEELLPIIRKANELHAVL